MSETVYRRKPSAPERAYAMKARGDQDAPEVIDGIISLYGIEMHALIDLGSTHSYVCIEHVFDKMTTVEQLSFDMHVTSPLGHNVNVNRVYKNCPIIIHDRDFSADLIALLFREFDLILGMDWLSKHWAIINCDKKIVVLRCEAFLALVLDSKRGQIELENILVVKDFPDVFPEELPGILLEREVDLSIEILPGTTPTSRAPYKMALNELKELKIQLQELLDKGFIRPSVSP